MIHNQWLYRNILVNKRRKDDLETKEGEVLTEKNVVILQEGEKQLENKEWTLLDHDWEEINEWHGIQKKVWVRSVNEAKDFKKRKLDEEEAARARQPFRRINIGPQQMRNCTSNERRRKRYMERTGARKRTRKK